MTVHRPGLPQDLPDVDLGEARVAVLVARQMTDLGELGGVDTQHDALGDHHDAVAPAVGSCGGGAEVQVSYAAAPGGGGGT